MTDIEKAKRLEQLFYIFRKKRASKCGQRQNEIRMHDMIMLGAICATSSQQENGMVKMSDISAYFHITPAAVSQMVKEYESKGWIQRVVLEKDRRSVYLKVSDTALKLMKKQEESVMQGAVDFIHYLGEEDSDALIRIMEKANAYGPILKHEK